MQVRSLKAKRFLGGPRGFPMEFFHRVPSPPRPQQGVTLGRIDEKAPDRFPGACACRSLIGPAASTYVQKAGLVRMNVGNDSRTNGNFWVVRARRQPLEITEKSRKPAFVTGFTPWLH